MFSDCFHRLQIPDSHQHLLAKTGPTPPHAGDGRRFARRYAIAKAVLEYQPSLPALKRENEKHCVLVLDLSRGGLRFFHSEQVFPGERLIVTLTEDKRLPIEIAWCQRVSPQCYQVGARFCLQTADKTSGA